MSEFVVLLRANALELFLGKMGLTGKNPITPIGNIHVLFQDGYPDC